MPFRSCWWMIALLVATPLVGAAAQDGGACCTRPLGVGRPAAAVLTWPMAPEVPRVAFAGSVSSELDVGKRPSGLARFRQVLAGARTNVRGVERPHDVFVDGSHRLYVTDGTARTVMVFDPRAKEARQLGTDGPGRLAKPLGLGGDHRGNVYVADQGGKRVVAFDSAGTFLRAFGGASVLLNPVDVAVDGAAGLVYVADSYLHQVLVFREDGRLVRRLGRDQGDLARKLKLLAAFAASGVRTADASHMAGGVSDSSGVGMFGHAPKYLPEPRDLVENRGARTGEFRYPAFVAVGGDGTLYVSDGMNFRIQAFDRDGKFLRSFGTLGDNPGSFARPKGVAVDSEGHVYVADAAFNNVQVFDARGQLLLPFGQIGRGPGQLWLPLGLAVDRDDHIYVADRYNNRVQIFEYLQPPERTAARPARPSGPL